jgi:threonine dehydrogenase-like Zn-dependent dehydrogenase
VTGAPHVIASTGQAVGPAAARPANPAAWVDDIVPLLTDEDPLRVESFATHHLPLSEAPSAYEQFQKTENGMIKVIFQP